MGPYLKVVPNGVMMALCGFQNRGPYQSTLRSTLEYEVGCY